MKISLLLLAITFAISPKAIDKHTSKIINKEIYKIYKIKNFSLEAITHDKAKEINGDFFLIKTQENIGYCYLGKVYTSRGNNINNIDAEFFEYFIILNKNKQIESVKIHKYEASYGQEICSRSWLKLFIGYSGRKELKVGKEVDIISGATLSSNAITKDINIVSKYLNEL